MPPDAAPETLMSQNVVLTCPNCATQFSAPVGQFLPDGRQVRCSKCQHVWFHAAPSRNRIDPSNKVAHMAPMREAITRDTTMRGAPVRDAAARDADGKDTVVQKATVSPPATADARAGGRAAESAAPRRKAEADPAAETDSPAAPRRRRVSWWAGGFWSWLLWAIALLLLLAILAYVFRDPLRTAVPQAAPLLDRYTGTVDKTAQGLTGRTAQRDPFQFRNIHYDVKEYDGEKTILVEADLVNTGPDDMPAPKVRVRVVDDARAPLHASVIAPEDMSESIAAGASTRYFVRIPEAPADFEAVLLNVEKE